MRHVWPRDKRRRPHCEQCGARKNGAAARRPCIGEWLLASSLRDTYERMLDDVFEHQPALSLFSKGGKR